MELKRHNQVLIAFIGLVTLGLIGCSEAKFSKAKPQTYINSDVNQDNQDLHDLGDNLTVNPDEDVVIVDDSQPDQGDSGDQSDSGDQTNNNSGVNNDNSNNGDDSNSGNNNDPVNNGDNGSTAKADCQHLENAEILLYVERLELRTEVGVIDVEGPLGQMTLDSIINQLVIPVPAHNNLLEVRVILSVQGNFALDSDNDQIPIKVPSGVQTGLKLKASGQGLTLPGIETEVAVRSEVKNGFRVHSTAKGCMITPPVFNLVEILQ